MNYTMKMLVYVVFAFVSIQYGSMMSTFAEETKKESEIVADSTSTPDKTLLFFINPNGSPCQMQDQILMDMGSTLTEKAQITYIKTTITADRKMFSEYGIRALPFLIVIDKNKKVLKRFAPGIQSAEIIMSVLNETK